MKVVAVLFDAFGTLLKIHKRTNPFRALLLEGKKHGRQPRAADLHMVMTHSVSLGAAAELLGIQISHVRLNELQAHLDDELESIAPFADALDAVSLLQQAGLKIGICSNLAAPYGAIVRKHFPTADATGFSYELGIMKPDPLIFHSVCAELGVIPGRLIGHQDIAVMIGDSLWRDCYAARGAGLNGFHLKRVTGSPIPDLASFSQLMIDHMN